LAGSAVSECFILINTIFFFIIILNMISLLNPNLSD
jgi:F0F1-type ATP synthase membrane subunit a